MRTIPYIYTQASITFWMEDGPNLKLDLPDHLSQTPHDISLRIYLRGCTACVRAEKLEEVSKLRNSLAAIVCTLSEHIAKHATAEVTP